MYDLHKGINSMRGTLLIQYSVFILTIWNHIEYSYEVYYDKNKKVKWEVCAIMN